jgi:hypothetical protein
VTSDMILFCSCMAATSAGLSLALQRSGAAPLRWGWRSLSYCMNRFRHCDPPQRFLRASLHSRSAGRADERPRSAGAPTDRSGCDPACPTGPDQPSRSCRTVGSATSSVAVCSHRRLLVLKDRQQVTELRRSCRQRLATQSGNAGTQQRCHVRIRRVGCFTFGVVIGSRLVPARPAPPVSDHHQQSARYR